MKSIHPNPFLDEGGVGVPFYGIGSIEMVNVILRVNYLIYLTTVLLKIF